MRHTIFAPSFDKEVEEIGTYIQNHPGDVERHEFVADLMAICWLVASFPAMGKYDHRYGTPLAGFVFRQNWIFFDYDQDEVQFLYIVDSRQERKPLN